MCLEIIFQFLYCFKNYVLSCTNLKLISQCKKSIRSMTFCTRLYSTGTVHVHTCAPCCPCTVVTRAYGLLHPGALLILAREASARKQKNETWHSEKTRKVMGHDATLDGGANCTLDKSAIVYDPIRDSVEAILQTIIRCVNAQEH